MKYSLYSAGIAVALPEVKTTTSLWVISTLGQSTPKKVNGQVSVVHRIRYTSDIFLSLKGGAEHVKLCCSLQVEK